VKGLRRVCTRDTIQKRIATYPAGSLHFNLQAIRNDPLPNLYSQLASLESSMDDEQAQITKIKEQILREETKRRQWDVGTLPHSSPS
jgi:ubiquitin carboxyl-terminal hydrolase L5